MKKILLLNLLALFLISCGSQKYLPKGAPPLLKEKSFLKEINEAENQIQSLSFKTGASFENIGGKQSFKLEVRFIKDSVVWLDISDPFIGIKLARAVIYKDSMALINKLQRQYYTGRPSDLSKELGVDLNFDLLQNMLSGNMIFPINNDDYDLYFGIDEYILADYTYQKDSLIQKPFGKSHVLKFYPALKKPKEQIFSINNIAKSYDLTYSDYQEVESIKFPKSIQINYRNQNKYTSLQLQSIQNIQLNKVNNLPFSIPSNYERMP